MANQSIKDAFQRFWEYVTAKVDSQKMLLITVTGDSAGEYTADKTYAQIIEAINAGRDCKVHLKKYSSKANGYFMDLVYDATGQYPYVEFAETLGDKIYHHSLSIDINDRIYYYSENTYSCPTDDYYLRRIKFSETAETPTVEGDICFKLK